MRDDGTGVVSAVRLHRHPRCARTLSTPSLQALTRKRVVASLLGHSRLVALCSLLSVRRVNRTRDLIDSNTK